MNDQNPLSSEHRRDVAAGIFFTVITCGIYNIFWNYRQMKALNALLGREEFIFGKWALFSLLTCGLYHIYVEYRMGAELQQWLVQNSRAVTSNLAIIGLVLSLLGLTVITDAVYQHEINKLT